ncbi:glycosyl hydrolase family 57, partial [cf. Phormidesmis sp. LEGE 11477]|nr:glycosyl hydrolase family 57 [cf. Phormidesmis sp. LEGE 11477]
LWETVAGEITSEKVRNAIAQLKDAADSISMTGGSWTNDRSWVEGYSDVLTPMEELSNQFHQKIAATGEPLEVLRKQLRYRDALLHNLLLQTSCFRYWGQGGWTDYAKEIYRRGLAILKHDF